MFVPVGRTPFTKCIFYKVTPFKYWHAGGLIQSLQDCGSCCTLWTQNRGMMHLPESSFFLALYSPWWNSSLFEQACPRVEMSWYMQTAWKLPQTAFKLISIQLNRVILFQGQLLQVPSVTQCGLLPCLISKKTCYSLLILHSMIYPNNFSSDVQNTPCTVHLLLNDHFLHSDVTISLSPA